MKEIITHVEGILNTYNISFADFNKYPRNRLQLVTSDPHRLQQFIETKFHKQIGMHDAQELEILFLTYNYVNQ